MGAPDQSADRLTVQLAVSTHAWQVRTADLTVRGQSAAVAAAANNPSAGVTS